jgi:hypothetical protein
MRASNLQLRTLTEFLKREFRLQSRFRAHFQLDHPLGFLARKNVVLDGSFRPVEDPRSDCIPDLMDIAMLRASPRGAQNLTVVQSLNFQSSTWLHRVSVFDGNKVCRWISSKGSVGGCAGSAIDHLGWQGQAGRHSLRHLLYRPSASADAPSTRASPENTFLTLPTALTLGRVAAVPALAAAWFTQHWTACTVLFLAAAITDFLDGYLARKLVRIACLANPRLHFLLHHWVSVQPGKYLNRTLLSLIVC